MRDQPSSFIKTSSTAYTLRLISSVYIELILIRTWSSPQNTKHYTLSGEPTAFYLIFNIRTLWSDTYTDRYNDENIKTEKTTYKWWNIIMILRQNWCFEELFRLFWGIFPKDYRYLWLLTPFYLWNPSQLSTSSVSINLQYQWIPSYFPRCVK